MVSGFNSAAVNRIAFIGNYQPRQCGIATFTTDLCEAISAEFADVSTIALPVNDVSEGYAYPDRVRFELTEQDIHSYRSAADFLNINNLDLVSLQHEYGIYGGRAGSHILTLLRELHMPIVTTLHTVLRDPDPDQRRVLEEVIDLSDRVVVMSRRASDFMQEIYQTPAEKIDLIPHGIPDMPFVDPAFHKDQFGVEGQTVLLTCGLVSPNKGIETVISALPAILEQHPNLVYIVVGATHPNVRRQDGETYRLSLQRLAHQKGVEDHVMFYNRFVSLDELVRFIGTADIYITPYLSQNQIVSGTLAYALGAGKAVISTPYWYAEEMLADQRGVLTPFGDSAALAGHVNELLDNEAERNAMRKRAYLCGREMIWPRIARTYMESFERARVERRRLFSADLVVREIRRQPIELPPLKLDHLRHMTDETGILQHAVFNLPNYREGYTIDDNARALMVSILLEETGSQEAAEMAARYLAFVWYAFNSETGRFRNFMSYQRQWLENSGSDDSHGRALWAIGTLLGRSGTPALLSMASQLLEQALPAVLDMPHPRSWAFALLGIQEYLKRFAGDRMAGQVRSELASRLLRLYQEHRSPDWMWFEDTLTYCNAVLPHALLTCGQGMSDHEMIDAGIESLGWLADLQNISAPDTHYVPIGCDGFYPRGGIRARFDQQPVEAQSMISACLEAYRVTSDMRWRDEANRAFEWYLGRNDLSIMLYDPSSGGCRDGLHPDRANENQGAESSLAFLQARVELQLVENAFQTVEIAPK